MIENHDTSVHNKRAKTLEEEREIRTMERDIARASRSTQNQSAKEGRDRELDTRDSVRTYHSDIAEAIERKGESLATIAIAEEKRREEETPAASPAARYDVVRILASILILTLASAALFFSYRFITKRDAAVPPEAKPSFLISVDEIVYIPLNISPGEEGREVIKSALLAIPKDPPAVTALVPTFPGIEGTDSAPDTLAAREFLEKLGLGEDTAFLRSVENEFLLGGESDGASVHGFLILTASFFENAYAGMLRLEPHLKTYFSFLAEEGGESPEEAPGGAVVLVPGGFTDGIIANHDVRILKNKDGSIALLYGFADSTTIIVTGSKETFEEILNRMAGVRFLE